ncbi:MAG: signal peptidase I [Chloroflexi bacterium]|nr:signal peptidase I [Chloroflexota bacterium]
MWAAIRETIETILLTLLIFLLVRSVVQNFRVEGESMLPTLNNGQYLLVNKAVYWELDPNILPDWLPGRHSLGQKPIPLFHLPQRGDIIVFQFPRETTKDFIKRVIGLPGDIVVIKGGKVYVNGLPLDEPYIKDLAAYEDAWVVPEGYYFVLGDNRNNSSDSHVWGMVPQEYIIGQAWFTYWPVAEWGFVGGQAVHFQSANASP